MPKIEASKLNRSLKQVLEGVAEGKRYELTRYGKTVAKIVPPNTREPKVEIVKSETSVSASPTRRASPDELRAKRRAFLMRTIKTDEPT